MAKKTGSKSSFPGEESARPEQAPETNRKQKHDGEQHLSPTAGSLAEAKAEELGEYESGRAHK